MSLLLGYMGNEPERTRCALHLARDVLVMPESKLDGWGIGFYQGGEVLLQKRPRASDSADFPQHLGKLQTDVLVAHLHEDAERTEQKEEDQDPYRFRSWLFAFDGDLEPAARTALLEPIPDFLRRNIRGKGDAETLFYLLLTFLHQQGTLEDPEPTDRVIRAGLEATIGFLKQVTGHSETKPVRFTLILTNGRVMAAVQHGLPLYLLRISAIADCQLCRQRQGGRESKRMPHEHLRAALVLSPMEWKERPFWEPVPAHSIVTINHDIVTNITSLIGREVTIA